MKLKIGLKYTCPSKGKNWYGKIINITDTTVHVEFYQNHKSTGTGSDPIETVINYFEIGYFEIKDDFVLPENWHVRVTEENRSILSKWLFGNNSTHYTPINYIIGICKWKDGKLDKGHNGIVKDKDNFYDFGTEITFNQFKEYVLKEKSEIFNYIKLINMLKYINERNRTFT